jgi:hypothetical protein
VVARSLEVVHFQGLRRDEAMVSLQGHVPQVIQQLHKQANKGWEAPKPRLGTVTQWRSGDGRLMLVSEMEDSHLLNAERYVRVKAEESRRYGRSVTPGTEYEAMLEEIRHRGLEPLPGKGEHPLKAQIEARLQLLTGLIQQAHARSDYREALVLSNEQQRLHRQLQGL